MRYVEKLLARKFITDLLNDGKRITVDFERGYDAQPHCGDDVDAILAQMDQVDECWLMIGTDTGEGYDGYLYFIWGNGNGGWDCLSDYTTGSIEAAIKPTLAFIEKEGD